MLAVSQATAAAGQEKLRQLAASREANHIQFKQSMAAASGRTAAEQFDKAPEAFVHANDSIRASYFWEIGAVGDGFGFLY